MPSFNEATCTPSKLMVQIVTLVFHQHSTSQCVFFLSLNVSLCFYVITIKIVISSSLLTSVFCFYDFLYINILVYSFTFTCTKGTGLFQRITAAFPLPLIPLY
uniref:Putative ovule protein n=1 Tax=Solanum chacoense TaxID=4108 RepID=A0A0V0IGE7_SOLCH